MLRNGIAMAAMVVASGLALALKPTVRVADSAPKINLETLIPHQFGEWREIQSRGVQIIDPIQKAVLDQIYNQTLSRTYVNPRGYGIMLSVAYGSDQSDALQVHKPEVCYPAQGFQVEARHAGVLKLPIGTIPATRLMTSLGSRKEPITYWITVGNRVVQGSIQRKLVQMSFGLGGKIPDGLLIRISSIDGEAARAYRIQDEFAEAMVGAVAVEHRARLVGTLQQP